ncbi:MAG: efflux RND transporter periplasmic adaptor subunit [Bacteroidetes bacterium]|nr:efflux RND transporter periplasmic adaptor subunit [Bacteroidota bacterium]
MFKKLYIILFAVVFAFLGACSNEHDHEAEVHEHGGTSVTQYTDSTEIFMEYPALVVNGEAKFLVHLTDLKNFKAVTQGILTVVFTNGSGTKLSLTEDKPVRDGIYTPIIKFPEPGNYTMNITLKGKQVNDNIVVNDVKVYSNENEIPHEEETASAGISFLKEQQWKIDFDNEPVVKRIMQKSVLATGEIKPKLEYFAKIVSPLSGIVLNKNNSNLKSIGAFVKKGEVLLNISPSADASLNIQEIKNNFLLAKSEYERAQNLYEKKAVPQKRLHEAKFDFESKQLSYNSLADQIKITENGYSIISPIDGYIEMINFNLGDQINSGRELFTVINPNRLILKANVPSTQIEAAVNSNNASFFIEGINGDFRISDLNGKKISVAAGLDEANRTIPVYFEFNNPQNKIKIGMYAEVYLMIDSGNEYLAIPESAIIDEDGLHTAYVQAEGEAFEKRILKTGITDRGYVQILEGLKVGERVVTQGAYQVRLAALSPESAIGQGHVH